MQTPKVMGNCSTSLKPAAVIISHHLLAADEGVHRFGEVFVGAGFVAADEGGGAREDFAEVEVVQAAQDRVGRQGEFEDDQPAAGAEDAMEFADGCGGVGDVADAEGDGQHIAAGVGQRKRHGVAVDIAKARFLPGDREHFVGEIDSDGRG